MLTLAGKLINVSTAPFTDRETGVITPVHTAEVLHSARGKFEVVSVKLDASCLESWKKAEGRDVAFEVGYYAMKTREGGIQKGLMLADKKALPQVARAPIAAAA